VWGTREKDTIIRGETLSKKKLSCNVHQKKKKKKKKRVKQKRSPPRKKIAGCYQEREKNFEK